MLTFDQVKSFYSEKEQLNPKNMLVEYIQCEILDSLFRQKESRHLSFIGGTALRIVYQMNRFSEDLDFDNFGLDFKEFEQLLEKVVRDMEIKGFSVEFRFVEKLAYHCYIRFPKLLQNALIARHPEEKILVRIDTVQKKKWCTPEVFILNRFDVYRDISVNPLPVILAQKLLAILGRKREKGRDFYDVHFLWGRTTPDFEYIKKVSGMSQESVYEALIDRCQSLDFSRLAKDVEPFLMNVEQSRRVKNFYEFIRSKSISE